MTLQGALTIEPGGLVGELHVFGEVGEDGPPHFITPALPCPGQVLIIPGCGHQIGQIWAGGVGWLEPPTPGSPPTSSRAGRRQEGAAQVRGNWRQAGALYMGLQVPGPSLALHRHNLRQLQGCNSPVRVPLSLLPHKLLVAWLRLLARKRPSRGTNPGPRPQSCCSPFVPWQPLPGRNSLEVKRWGFLVGFLLTSLRL